MYRQHFGLSSQPLGKDTRELWDDGPIAALKERFQWLLENPGVALLTGDPGVGKTSALRQIADGLNPHRYKVIYMAETDFGRMDIYRQLALALGLDAAFRRSQLWRDIKARILKLADGEHVLPVWIIDAGAEPSPGVLQGLPRLPQLRLRFQGSHDGVVCGAWQPGAALQQGDLCGSLHPPAPAHAH